VQLTLFTESSLTEPSEKDGTEPQHKAVGAVALRLPPYLADSREARLSQLDVILNDLGVEIHGLPTPLRHIVRLILYALLESREALEQGGE
jgi:hypothetical protein